MKINRKKSFFSIAIILLGILVFILFNQGVFTNNWSSSSDSEDEHPEGLLIDFCTAASDTIEYPVEGYRWVKVNCEAEFAPRDGAGALVYNNSMFLIGGWNPVDSLNFPLICNNEVWKSENGKSWNLVKKNTFIDSTFDKNKDWEGRHTAGYTVFNNKMWIVGGDANQGHYQNDVWNSVDGENWDLINDSVPWGPRAMHYTVAFKNKIWIMGGQTVPQIADAEEKYYYDIWNSTDGINWAKVKVNPNKWLPRGLIGGCAVYEDRMWIIGGGTYDTPDRISRILYSDVWSTADGINWDCHTPYAKWDAREYHDVAVFDNKLWLLEGTSLGHIKGQHNRNDVWYSEDGETWIELPNTPWEPRHASSIFVYKGAMYVVGGNNMASDVWRLEKIGDQMNASFK